MAKKTAKKKAQVKRKPAARASAKKPVKRRTTTAGTKRTRKRSTTDALEIIDRRFSADNPEWSTLLEQARADDDVGRKIYALRTKANLSQRQLAKRVGTTASVICRLEDADYEGHSLPMLRRIAAALDKRIEIRFVSARKKATT
ncbi:MAG: helix-turn-helix transcriptional regulator [Pirellulaceae bacterium]